MEGKVAEMIGNLSKLLRSKGENYAADFLESNRDRIAKAMA
jgi:hypothetical protein